MTEQDIKDSLIGFYCLDTEGIDSKVKNTISEERTKRILEKMEYEDDKSIDRLISSLLYESFLSSERINKGYGIQDAKSFLDWFETFRSAA